MGDESNFFHCDLVRPHTEELLDAKDGEVILDIAFTNGFCVDVFFEVPFDGQSEPIITIIRARKSLSC